MVWLSGGFAILRSMDKIAVVDFGSQYAHLIANRVRRLGVYAEILLPEASLEEFSRYKGIILSGGPQSVYEKGAPTIDAGVFELGVPVLGVCYGHQLMAHLLGGKVVAGTTKEYGLATLKILKKEGIFKRVSSATQVWMSHGDTVKTLPPGFERLAETNDCPNAAGADLKRNLFSTQFHIEVVHTPEGMKMLENFVERCGAAREWSMAQFMESKMSEIKNTLAGRNVFLMVSGGVDSTVAYALLSKALGTARVYGLFVDTGLLRKDEQNAIRIAFKKIGIKNFHIFPAQKKFLAALKGIVEPEQKRKIIGDMFLKIQAEAVKKLKLNPAHWVLGQGTIYPDTIESKGTKYADKIKTHHNRVPEILKLMKKGLLIEPVAELYKDEVRALGEKLGLPASMVWKHPFPGPGLGVRILCAKKAVLPKDSEEAELAIEEFLRPYKLTGTILPIQSVGVQGDARTYRNPLVIWPARTGAKKITTAPSFAALEKISTALTNRFPQINRVCLLLAPQEIKNVKVIPSYLTASRVKNLQKLDAISMDFVAKNKLNRVIWQFPTVLVPLLVNNSRREAVVLRPICSDEAMTANFYKMPPPLLKKLTRSIAPHASAVLYDITNKPPATIEWE